MKTPLRILLCALLLLGAAGARAQYYTWGPDAASLRWRTIRTPEVRMIYPDTCDALVRRTLQAIEAVQPSIGYGFRHGPLRIPFVVHPQNFRSNGLVMWLPKRVEFLSTPAVESYAMPWYKQLVAHEYRHAVQYNNLNRGVIRALSYLLGQQGSTVGLLFLPIWLLEGDATLTETHFSSFGRGLQPSFTMEYRALGDEVLRRRNVDRWFCGSYRTNVPDHYRLGFQIAAYTDRRWGHNIWDKVAWYSVRNPYLIFSTSIALRKFYDTGVSDLFRETFAELNFRWNALPAREDSAAPLCPLPDDNYTTYAHPLALRDGRLLLMKSDFDRPERFVVIDPATGRERAIRHTGSLSTRPALSLGAPLRPTTAPHPSGVAGTPSESSAAAVRALPGDLGATPGDRVWWTEYRRSLLWEQKVDSRLCYMDLREGRPHTVRGLRNVLYPTPIPEGLAWVAYSPDGRFTVEAADERDLRHPRTRCTAPFPAELHGLAWDDRTERLYTLVTDDRGMWIARIEPDGSLHPVTPPTYATLSGLRAGDGRLYFGSIASGYDEAHCLDLRTGRQWRLTTSRYGAFQPAPAGDGRVAVVTYSRHGYAPALQRGDTLHAVIPARLPLNVVNAPLRPWPVAPIDTLRFTPADSLRSQTRHPARRYAKGTHLFNVHSWAPAAYDPFTLIDEQNIDIALGVTLLSQNLLSSTEGYLSYAWSDAQGSIVRGGLRYTGLGVRLDAEASYGGRQLVYSLAQLNDKGQVESQERPHPDEYYAFSASLTLPLVFDRGYRTRTLSLSAGWNYSNGMVARVGRLIFDPETHHFTNLRYVGYDRGLHKLSFGIGFSNAARAAYRDVATPHGYTLSASYAFNPANRDFSSLVSLYGKLYTPGLLPRNSLTVAASYQTSLGGFRFPWGASYLTYKSTRLIPRGFDAEEILSRNYFSASADYQFPLWYPEGGIGSVLYIKRLRFNLGGDYAQFDAPGRDLHTQTEHIHSWGGDLIVDFNLFRQPASATSSVRLSLYFPSKGGTWFGASLGLPF